MKPVERIVDISYPLQSVWEAAWTALPLAGWELTRADRARGHFEAKVGTSLWTWGEEFSVNLAKIGDGSTRIQVWGRVRYQYYDWGKTRKDIDRFIYMLQIVLKER
jgi:hypothetical protein